MGWCIGVELMHLGSIDHGEWVRDHPHRRNCAHMYLVWLQRAIWHNVLPHIDSPAPSMQEVSIGEFRLISIINYMY